jgi:hypothetical protein
MEKHDDLAAPLRVDDTVIKPAGQILFDNLLACPPRLSPCATAPVIEQVWWVSYQRADVPEFGHDLICVTEVKAVRAECLDVKLARTRKPIFFRQSLK